MVLIFFVYVAPITRINGTTNKLSSATSQQHIAAIRIAEKKVAKLDRK
jgi:hypothetical protein